MSEETYPCDKCGLPRTKAEGGTTFTLCDECWDKQFQKLGDHPATDAKEIAALHYKEIAEKAIKTAEEANDLLKAERRMYEKASGEREIFRAAVERLKVHCADANKGARINAQVNLGLTKVNRELRAEVERLKLTVEEWTERANRTAKQRDEARVEVERLKAASPNCPTCKNNHNMIWHSKESEWVCHSTHRTDDSELTLANADAERLAEQLRRHEVSNFCQIGCTEDDCNALAAHEARVNPKPEAK